MTNWRNSFIHALTLLACGVALSCITGLSWAAPPIKVGPGRTFTQLTAIVNVVGPGDIVEVDGNATYNTVKFTKSGTSTAPIIVRGIVPPGGSRPVISGGANTVQFEVSNHMVLEDVEITGGTSRCVFIHAHNITLRRVLVRDCPAHGILGADTESGDVLIEDSEVTRIATASNSDQLHAIYMSSDLEMYPNASVTLRNNFIHDSNKGNGIKTRAGRTNVYNNWIETKGSFYPLQVNGSEEYDCIIGTAPNVRGCNADVVGNVLIALGDAYLSFGDGTGVGSRGRIRMVNNTVIGGSSFGQFDSIIRIRGYIDSLELHNNIFYLAGGSQSPIQFIRDLEANWLRGSRTIVGSNNLITLGSTGTAYGGLNWLPTTLTNTLYTLPSASLFAALNVANPSLMDLRIVANSLARNIGSRSQTNLPGFEITNPMLLPAMHPILARPSPGNFTPLARPGATDAGGSSLPAAISAGAFEFIPANDTVPDTFAFAAQADVPVSVSITSGAVQITGITAASAISVANGSYAVVSGPSCSGASFITTASTISSGQYVCARHVSAAAPATVTTTTVTIGGVAANFISTTARSSQVITFANPGPQVFGAAPVALTASASSGLVVTLASATPAICNVSGSSATLLAAGTCTLRANQPGNATFLPAIEVVQTFNVTAGVPGAPVIGSAIAGNAQVTLRFSPPAFAGGAPILAYNATCNGVTASAPGLQITLSGLVNDTVYTCTVAAGNVAGTGPSSPPVTVTPTASAPLQLIAVKSRKSHGAAGLRDLDIDTAAAIGGNVTVEPRTGQPLLVFQFNNAVTAVAGASLLDANGAVAGIASPTPAGYDISVALSSALSFDRRRFSVALNGINGSLSAQVSLAFLAGDVNGSRRVNASDLSAIKARINEALGAGNFFFDIDNSGAIDALDLGIAKSNSAQVAP